MGGHDAAGVRQYPSAIQAGCESIQVLASRGWRCRKGLDRSLSLLAAEFAEGGYGVEVCWILDTMLGLGLRLSAPAGKAIDQMSDNPPLLYLLEFERQGLVDSRSSAGRSAKARASVATMYGSDWLLGYEANRHSYAANATVGVDRNYGPLLAANVAFFLPSAKGSLITAKPVAGSAGLAVPVAPDEDGHDDDFLDDEWWLYD